MNKNTTKRVDIHCHILPGVDDGPKDLEGSLSMAKDLVDSGVGHVFATPHYITGTAWTITSEQVRLKVGELQRFLQQSNIPLSLHPGMEIALHPCLGKKLVENTLQPLGSSTYYLLEPPLQSVREDLLNAMFFFKNSGKDVILAHPERTPFFQNNSEILFRLSEQGIMLQINIGSLLGYFGRKANTLALQLAQHERIHFVASDSHGIRNRKPASPDDWKMLEQILGPQMTKLVCRENPVQLLMGCNYSPGK